MIQENHNRLNYVLSTSETDYYPEEDDINLLEPLDTTVPLKALEKYLEYSLEEILTSNKPILGFNKKKLKLDRRRVQSLFEKLHYLMERYTKIFLVRLDLHVKKKNKEKYNEIVLYQKFKELLSSLDKYKPNEDKHSLGVGLLEYICKLEGKKNLHIHTCLIYNASVRDYSRHGYLATEILKLWSKITNGECYGFSSNLVTEEDKKKGLFRLCPNSAILNNLTDTRILGA